MPFISRQTFCRWLLVIGLLLPESSRLAAAIEASEQGTRVAFFQADVTPPLGSPLCDGYVPPADGVDDPARASLLEQELDGAPALDPEID